jgi:hypothetical protein
MKEPIPDIMAGPEARAGVPVRIAADPDRLIRNLLIGCIVFEVFLVLIDAFINYGKLIDIGPIRRLCNIAREDALASWFMVIQTFMAGLTLWAIFLVERARLSTRWTRVGWGILALFFTVMAADDGAEIHERLGSTFKAVVKAAPSAEGPPSLGTRLLEFFPSYPWQALLLPFFAGMGLFLLLFLWRKLDPPSSRIVVVAALGLFAAAVGLDFIEGLDESHPWNLHTSIEARFHVRDSYTIRHFAKSLEEFLEMLGITLLWSTFVKHFTRTSLQTLLDFRRP